MSKLKYLIPLFIIFLTFYVLTLKGVAGDPTPTEIYANMTQAGQVFETSQERARYALSKSIVEDDSVFLDKYSLIALPDVSYVNGHYISVFQPGVSVFVAPLLKLGLFFGYPVLFAYALPALLTILTGLLVFLISWRIGLSKTASFLGALIFPLATIAWPYSVTLYAHAFSAFCLMAGFYFALRARDDGWMTSLLVWMLYGIAIFIDFPNALIMLPVILLMLSRSIQIKRAMDSILERKIWQIKVHPFVTVFGLFLVLAVLALYNIETMGKWYSLAHNYRVTSAVANALSYNFGLGEVFSLKNLENGLSTLLFSIERGIFVFVPIVLVAVFGFAGLFKRFPYAIYLILPIALNLVIYSAFYDPWGGWAYGPRYLIVSMPILAVAIASAYDSYKRSNWFLLAFYSLFFVSFGIALLGALTSNLLAPSVETGKSITFLENISLLKEGVTASFAYPFVRGWTSFSLAEYFLAITAFFGLVTLPIFFYQFFANIVFKFRAWKMNKNKKMKEAYV